MCSAFQSLSARFPSTSSPPPPIGDAHTDALQRAAALVLSAPLCYPRFFFQSLQGTSVKLSVTPQPRAQGEPIGVSASQNMAIKVRRSYQNSQEK